MMLCVMKKKTEYIACTYSMCTYNMISSTLSNYIKRRLEGNTLRY